MLVTRESMRGREVSGPTRKVRGRPAVSQEVPNCGIGVTPANDYTATAVQCDCLQHARPWRSNNKRARCDFHSRRGWRWPIFRHFLVIREGEWLREWLRESFNSTYVKQNEDSRGWSFRSVSVPGIFQKLAYACTNFFLDYQWLIDFRYHTVRIRSAPVNRCRRFNRSSGEHNPKYASLFASDGAKRPLSI